MILYHLGWGHMGYIKKSDGRFTVDRWEDVDTMTPITVTKLREMELNVKSRYCPHLSSRWTNGQLPDFLLCAGIFYGARKEPPFAGQHGSFEVNTISEECVQMNIVMS